MWCRPIRISRPCRKCSTSTSSSSPFGVRSEEHTSELQSQSNLVCRLLLEKKKNNSCCRHLFLLATVVTNMLNVHASKKQSAFFISEKYMYVGTAPRIKTVIVLRRLHQTRS